MLKRCCLAAVLFLVALVHPGRAEAQYYFQLSDLEKLFVEDQQYFVLDNEGFGDASLNHLHFAHIDTTTGAFTGYLWAPQVVPAIPQMTIPVSGTITINTDFGGHGFSYGVGNFYQIAFSWDYRANCFDETASYTGGITFRGYRGSKMQASISGTVDVQPGACLVGAFEFTPETFSGVLVK